MSGCLPEVCTIRPLLRGRIRGPSPSPHAECISSANALPFQRFSRRAAMALDECNLAHVADPLGHLATTTHVRKASPLLIQHAATLAAHRDGFLGVIDASPTGAPHSGLRPTARRSCGFDLPSIESKLACRLRERQCRPGQGYPHLVPAHGVPSLCLRLSPIARLPHVALRHVDILSLSSATFTARLFHAWWPLE